MNTTQAIEDTSNKQVDIDRDQVKVFESMLRIYPPDHPAIEEHLSIIKKYLEFKR